MEGSGAARLSLLMQSQPKNDDGLTVATVTRIPPALAIRLDGDPFDLSGGELIVAEHLTEYKRQVSINGGPFNEMVVKSGLSVGDKVIVVTAQDGQLYYVLDKAV